MGNSNKTASKKMGGVQYEPISEQYQFTGTIHEIKFKKKSAVIRFEEKNRCFWCPIYGCPEIKKFGPGDIAEVTYEIIRPHGYSQCVIRELTITKSDKPAPKEKINRHIF